MKRRAIISALGAMAATGPMAARAQPAARPLRAAFRLGLVNYEGRSSALNAFFQRLAELGFVDGRNLTVVNEPALFPDLDAAYSELVKGGADVLLAFGPEPALKSARLAAAGRVPVVFIAMDYDPVRSGYVASLARPGGNLTGLFARQVELAAKRLEFARDALPTARRAALWWDANTARDQLEASSAAAPAHGFDLQPVEVGGVSYDFFNAARRSRELGADAIILASSTFYTEARALISQLALEHRLPLIAYAREFVEAGALLSYGINVDGLWWQAAGYVARIANGVAPSDLPVEQPTRFELVLNNRTASALGLGLAPTLLARADAVTD